jgi:protein phosphatase
VVEAAPISEAWNSQRYSSPDPPPGLAPYRIDVGAGGLPLPPPRPGSPYGGPSQPTMQDAMGQPYGPGGASPSGPYSSRSSVRPAKGGIVFVIIGLSAVIAVLLVIILWALLNR